MEKSKTDYRSRSGRKIDIQKSNIKLKQQLRSALRKIWSRYSIDKEYTLYLSRREFSKSKKDGSEAKKPEVRYQCEICQAMFKIEEVQVDHIEPIGKFPEAEYWTLLGEWTAKLFTTYDRLRVVCIDCHKKITKEQRLVSKIRRDK